MVIDIDFLEQLKKELPFDLYGRYVNIRNIILHNKRQEQNLRVLDVGGRGNLLHKFLPECVVYYLDPLVDSEDDNFIKADGCNMPLNDQCFDWVVSADVFEHIPSEKREIFLQENLRVAKLGVILVAPFYSKEAAEAEVFANERYKELSNGKNHPWLIEHIDNGLPSQRKVEDFLQSHNYTFQKLHNNYLPFWKNLITTYFLILTFGDQYAIKKLEKFNYFYNTNAISFDYEEPSYRKIYFIKKSDELLDIPIPEPQISYPLFLKMLHAFFNVLCEIEGLNKVFALQQSALIDKLTPHYHAQLFIDTGLGFNETQAIVMPVQGQEREIEFDLSSYHDIKTLRLDPLNDMAALHLNSIQLVSAEGDVIPIDVYQSNACYQNGNNLLFDMPDPHILFAAPVEQAQKVVFSLEYIALGQAAYPHLLSQKAQQFSWQTAELAQKDRQLSQKEAEIYQLTPHYAAQLFLDTGLGFNETQAIVMPVQGQEREIEFDLSSYHDIKTLRFDPLNDVAALHLNSIQLVSAEGDVIPIDVYQTNACFQNGSHLLFDTPDPNILFAAPVGQAQKIVISLEYIVLGFATYPYILQEKNRQVIEQARVLQTKDAELAQQSQVLQAKDTELAQQAQALQAKDTELAQQTQVLQAKDAELAQQTQALQERNQAIQKHDEIIRRYEEKLSREIRSKTQLIQMQDDMIYTMEDTLSWRITKPLRWLRNLNFSKRQWPYYDASWRGKLLRFCAKRLWPKRLILQSGLFDQEYYLKHNQDVGQTKANPLRHFLRHGGCEGRQPCVEFDSAYYLESNPDVFQKQLNPLLHYLLYGERDNRCPSPYFDPIYYREHNADVASQDFNLLSHYVRHGQYEGRFPNRETQLIRESGLFDKAYYLAQNPDVVQAGIDPLEHFLRQGGFEGRQPCRQFDPQFYLDTYPDIAQTQINPLVHYLLYGQQEGRYPNRETQIICESGLFDEAYYLSANPDIAKTGVDPLWHFLWYGGSEGRKPHPLFDSAYYLGMYPDVKQSGMNPLIHYLLYGGFEGRKPNPEFESTYYLKYNADIKESGMNPLVHYMWCGKKERRQPYPTIHNPYQLWIERNEPSQEELENQKYTKFEYHPKVSIITPTFNTPKPFLIEMIESVRNQTYSNWELCIADGASSESHVKQILEEYANKDLRIKIVFLPDNSGIAGNSNAALALADGDFITLLDHDDTLAPFALFEVINVLNKHPETDYIYSDEDKLSENGKKRFDPHFKPDWSPDFFRSYNYTMHLSVYRKDLIEQIGGFREGFEGSQDYDLNLRVIEKARKIVHISKILYHWRTHEKSVAGNKSAKLYAYDSAKKALQKHLERISLPGKVENGFVLGTYKITYEITNPPKISIIILNHDHAEDLERCIRSIIDKSSYKNFEIIIIEHGSVERKTFRLYEKLKQFDYINIIIWDKPFNSSTINNFGAHSAQGEVLLFLSNDTEVINPDWLERMVEHVLRKDVGGVGAKLYYPDDTIQHGGIILGIFGSIGYAHRLMPKKSPGYFRRLEIIQNFSAVTIACLMVRKKIFLDVGGFDERYTVDFNDVDLCLNIRTKGYLIVWTPYAELYHYESPTKEYNRTTENALQELTLFCQKWDSVLKKGDPYYSPHLTLATEDFSIREDRDRLQPSKEQTDATTKIDHENIFMFCDQAELYANFIEVSGWAVSNDEIAQVEIYLDGHFLGNATYGLQRSDVAKVYPLIKHSYSSGFSFYLDLDPDNQLQFGEHKILIKPITKKEKSVTTEISVNLKKDKEESDVTLTDIKFNAFLRTSAEMVFPEYETPLLTIILVLFNRSELTFQCLESIKTHSDIPYQIIIVDNASKDETSALLERLKNVTIIHNTENIGFLKACNQAIPSAHGQYVLFLNNDTQVLPQTFRALVNTISADPKIGVVGGKLIFPNGKLQEAGSIIWRDGSCAGYGREDDPFKPEYSYVREVDYCSGALLLTPRKLFIDLGMFDEIFCPAYYEEADYCMKVRERGYKVIYQPLAQVIHYEFASSGTSEEALRLQLNNKEKFLKKWQNVLDGYYEPQRENILFAREHIMHPGSKRILFLEDRVPDQSLGSGYPRCFDMVNALVETGYQVTFFPLISAEKPAEVINYFQQKGVEIFYDHLGTRNKLSFKPFFKDRHSYYDIMLISRPHNMDRIVRLKDFIDPKVKIVYDCEALFAVRELLYSELKGIEVAAEEKENAIKKEIELAKQAHSVITVSKNEEAIFSKYGVKNTNIIGFSLEPKPTPESFEVRKDLLFVGAINYSESPNEDAVLYFAQKIFPAVSEKIEAKLYIVGTNTSEKVWALHSNNIIVTGRVESILEYYKQCRIFLVPTRYAAGIPYKLYEASSFGLPAVVTPLIASQVGWEEGKSLLVGYDEDDFAQKCIELYTDKNLWQTIRNGALRMIERDCSPRGFKENLVKALENKFL